MIRLRPILLGAVVVAAPLGCALIAGLDGDRVLDTTSSTSGGGDGCARTRLPTPPPIALGGDGPDFTVAVRTVDFGEGKNGDQIGLDLDQTCTCPGPPSCAEPTWATAMHCDGALGRDDAAGRGFVLLNAFGDTTIDSAALSMQIGIGAWSVLLRVRGYGGQDTDSQVEVDLYPTTGMPTMTPKWDGSDAWPIPDTALGGARTSLEEPLFVDKQAYVVQKTLVARLPGAALVISSSLTNLNRLDVTLRSVILTAQISKTASGAWKLSKGTIAGVWALPDLFKDLTTLRKKGGGFCTDTPLYPSFRDALCSVVDIKADPASAGCDAISFGMSFESDPATLGTIVPLPPPGGMPCAPDAGVSTDPADDTCGPP